MATNFYRISPDQNQIFTGRQEYVFKPLKRKAFCEYCDICKACTEIDNATGEMVFPCVPEQRKDKKNGIFKRVKSDEEKFFLHLGIVTVGFIISMLFFYFS